MKLFLKKIAIFALYTGVFIIVISLANGYILKKAVKKAINLSTTETLILGDSHLEVALDPNKFNNAYNIANSSEPYSLTYYKLKYLLENKNNIKDVLLGFSYHNFQVGQDSITLDASNTNYTTFVTRYALFEIDDTPSQDFETSEFYTYNFLVWKLGFPSFKTMKLNLKYLRGKISIHDLPFVGSYKRYGRITAKENDIIIKNACMKYGRQEKNSKVQTAYLFKIKDMLSKRNIKLHLIASPLETNYKNCVNTKMLNEFEDLKKELVQHQVLVYDYTELALDKNYYKDPHHLSGIGSDYFSDLVSKEIFGK